MKKYTDMTREELQAEYEAVSAQYEQLKSLGLHLDMSRGKPNPAQLDLSMGMLRMDPFTLIHTRKGTDVRNYGELAGVDEAKELFAELLGVGTNQVIMGGQSSLNLMYDTVVKALTLGVYGGKEPWGKQGKLKFLCPVPGYDRHFAICQEFGIEMINITMTEDGPDMELVRNYVEKDPSVKGIWCVPKYSNPQGITYSDDTVRAFAALKPAADDFRIFWDNAYLIHDHGRTPDSLLNIFDACKAYGSEDMVYEFISTSKVTFSGAGVAVLASSEANTKHLLKQMGIQTIGYDKINQLRHVRFFKNAQGMRDHMEAHAALIRPRFDCVLGYLEQELATRGIGSWRNPNGGYFISYDGMKGSAKRCVQLCKEAGVVLTSAGATYPYGNDPEDKNIRIAPSFPGIEELAQCARLFCVVQRLVSLELLLAR